MSKNLLIVESPAKCKSIQKYLSGQEGSWVVLASYGHVRDFPRKNDAIDVNNDFAASYQMLDAKKPHVDRIISEARKADTIYLATDLDREGEAISWHITEILKERGVWQGKTIHRAVFSEITPKAVREAVANPRELSMDMVNAQRARSILDWLVGFNLSPVLWKKVKAGSSAGRVQSPALRMIVEREEEIEAFDPKEYWTVEMALLKEFTFQGKLWQYQGKKFEQFDLVTKEQAELAKTRLERASRGALTVGTVMSRERLRRPYAPFTTSTLQMDASRQLGFNTKRTMKIAQELYEGVTVNGDQIGVISYMRTDAVNLSEDALADIRQHIGKSFAPEFLPSVPNRYQSKSKNAQEAHEAIRPTSMGRTPDMMKKFLSDEQLKLYTLIWKRTLASQMTPAKLHTVTVDFPLDNCEGGAACIRSTGSTVIFQGFLAVYDEGKDQSNEDDETRRLPQLAQGDIVHIKDVLPIQHFTEPPPRFNEATLVKTLEEHDIGRPSTYANIIDVLQRREYVELDGRRFVPTDLGRAVGKFLAQHFTKYVDYDFTANLENLLDAISRGETKWLGVLHDFWIPFIELIKEKVNTVDRGESTGSRVLGQDPATGKDVIARLGRFGPMVQLGQSEKGAAEKPRMVSLTPTLHLHTVTLEQALTLLNERGEFPKVLGKNAQGEDIVLGRGQFGPYIKESKLYVSIPEGNDIHSVTLEDALRLIAEKKIQLAEKYVKDFGGGVQILKGKFGVYVTDGRTNATLPERIDPKSMSKEDALLHLKEHGKKKGGGRFKGKGGFKKGGDQPHGHSQPKPGKGGKVDDLPM